MKKIICENKKEIEKKIEEYISQNKSMVILDTNKEYERQFKDAGYEVIKFDISDLDNSVHYNPLFVAQKLFENGDIDNAIEKIVCFGNLLFHSDDRMDPYWDNAARSVFIGICLYILNNKRDLTLKEVIKVSNDEFDTMCDYINNLDVLNYMSVITSSVINAPLETKGGILSVLRQNLGSFAQRPNLLNKICVGKDFELKDHGQVILLTNFKQRTIFNIIIEFSLINIINEMIDSGIEYRVILDNYDSIINKEEFNKIFDSYLSDHVECLIG